MHRYRFWAVAKFEGPVFHCEFSVVVKLSAVDIVHVIRKMKENRVSKSTINDHSGVTVQLFLKFTRETVQLRLTVSKY